MKQVINMMILILAPLSLLATTNSDSDATNTRFVEPTDVFLRQDFYGSDNYWDYSEQQRRFAQETMKRLGMLEPEDD